MNSAEHLLAQLKSSSDINLQESALVVAALIEEMKERDRSFEIHWNCSQRAIKEWQKNHPGNDLVWPDQARLMVWLMEQIAFAKTALSFADEQLNLSERGTQADCPCGFCQYGRARAQFKV